MTCPKCSTPVRDGNKFCNKCGCNIESAATVSLESPKPERQQLTCPTCGKALKPESKFCTGCGAVLDFVFGTEAIGMPEQNSVDAKADVANPAPVSVFDTLMKKRKLWILVCCALVAVVCVTGFLLLQQRNNAIPATVTSSVASSAVSSKSETSVPVSSEVESSTASSESVPPKIDGLYRVRKSWDDDKTQIGAFAEFENAKKHADDNADEGYKVFDPDGTLVYEPETSAVTIASTEGTGGYSTNLQNIITTQSQSDYYRAELMKDPFNDEIYKQLESFCEQIGNKAGRVAVAEMRYKMGLIGSWILQVIREQNEITYDKDITLFSSLRNIAEDIPDVYPTSPAEIKAEAGETIHYRLSQYIDYDYYRTLNDRSTPFPGMSKSQLELMKRDTLEYTGNLNVAPSSPRVAHDGDLIDARLVKLNSSGLYGILISKYDSSNPSLPCIQIKVIYYDRNCESRCVSWGTNTGLNVGFGTDETFYVSGDGVQAYYYSEFDFQSLGTGNSVVDYVQSLTTIAEVKDGAAECYTDAKQGLEKTLRELDDMIAKSNLN